MQYDAARAPSASRRTAYASCLQFETLDESVQAQFEAFLTERGIDSDLARFVPDFAELKEQRGECCAKRERMRERERLMLSAHGGRVLLVARERQDVHRCLRRARA
jgi:hypothetical protein